MNDVVRILLVEDNPPDALLVREYLEDSNRISFELTVSETLKDALGEISSKAFDVILLDLNLPDSNGLETFDTVIDKAPNIPIIPLTGMNDDAMAVEMIKQGAQNFIVKDEINSLFLTKTIQYSIERKKSEIEILRLNRLYAVLSNTNQVTVRIQEKNALLKEICRIVVEEGQFTFAWIGLLNPVTNKIDVTSYGKSSINVKKITACEWLSEEALRTGEHVFVKRLSMDTRESKAKNEAIKAGCRSAASIPLFISGEIIGTFNLYSNSEGVFRGEEVKLLDEVASDISFSLKYIESELTRKKVEEEIRVNSAGLKRILKIYEHDCIDTEDFFSFAAEQILHLTSSSGAYIFSYDNEAMMFKKLSSAAVEYAAEPIKAGEDSYLLNDTGIFIDVIEKKLSLRLNDTSRIKHLPLLIRITGTVPKNVLVVPVLERDEIVAIACVINKGADYSDMDEIQMQLMMNSVWKMHKRRETDEHNIMLSKVVEQNPVSIMITDTNGTIEYVNSRFTELTEYSQEEVIGKNPRILKSGYHSAEFYESLYQSIFTEEKVYVDMMNKKKSGKLFWESSLISPIKNDRGEITHFICTKQDITERKENQERLIKLSRAVEQSTVSISISNRSGVIEYVNPKLMEVTGFKATELLGQTHNIFKSGFTPVRVYQNLWWTILSGKEWKGELLNKRKNGELYWENLVISPIINEKGEVTNFVAIGEDITEKRKMIDDLIKAKEAAEQSNILKDSFIANISHEIRTPLNGMLGLTEILRDDYGKHIKTGDEFIFTGIKNSADRIIRTVEMILNYSRLRSNTFLLQPKQVCIDEVCKEIIRTNSDEALEKNIKLIYRCDIENPELHLDEYTIKNAVTNLVENAIKFTKAGHVKVSVTRGSDESVQISVEDTGIGIEEEYLKYLFEPFRQEETGYGRAYEGVGLGLALTNEYFSLNGAQLKVTSKKGAGSTFTATFKNKESVHPEKNALLKSLN